MLAARGDAGDAARPAGRTSLRRVEAVGALSRQPGREPRRRGARDRRGSCCSAAPAADDLRGRARRAASRVAPGWEWTVCGRARDLGRGPARRWCATPTWWSPTPARTRSPRSPPPGARRSWCPRTARTTSSASPPRRSAAGGWPALVEDGLPRATAGPRGSSGPPRSTARRWAAGATAQRRERFAAVDVGWRARWRGREPASAVVTVVHGRHEHLRAPARARWPRGDRSCRTSTSWSRWATPRSSGALAGGDVRPRRACRSPPTPGGCRWRPRATAASRPRAAAGCDVVVVPRRRLPGRARAGRGYADAVRDEPDAGVVRPGHLPAAARARGLPAGPAGRARRPAPGASGAAARGGRDRGRPRPVLVAVLRALGARRGERTGGFDEAYVGYGGEDTDFGRRRGRARASTWPGSAPRGPTTSTTR